MERPNLQQGGIHFKDISESVAGQVAEVRVAHQALHQRLFERFSGTSPQLLHFGHTLPSSSTWRPATVEESCFLLSVLNALLKFFKKTACIHHHTLIFENCQIVGTHMILLPEVLKCKLFYRDRSHRVASLLGVLCY